MRPITLYDWNYFWNISLLIIKTTWYFAKKGLPLCKKKAWKLWRKHVEVKQF